jgi:hypothetical protein
MYTEDYKKIWKKHHGLIPKDETGRSFDIHHIDGDKTNNNIENLYACSIQEHYDIHYSQGDWGACFLIAKRMKLSPELISELNSRAARKRVEQGTMWFQSEEGKKKLSENATKINFEKSSKGIHQWQGENNPGKRKVKDGTHHFLGPSLNLKRIKNGTHNWATPEGIEQNRQRAIERIKNGNHPFSGENNPGKRQKLEIFECEICQKKIQSKGNYTQHLRKCKRINNIC